MTKGSAPTFSATYSASTNRRSGDTADSNGNITYVNSQYLTYDIENGISGVGTYSGDTSVAQYGYDAGNKRVWRGGAGPSGSLDELTFWAPNGQKLGTYEITYDSNYLNYYLKLKQTWVYFGGKLVSKGALYTGSGSGSDKVALSSVVQDRLGSQNGKFYPYGIERPSATANDTEKFATYTRDSATGLDYADQRYFQAGYGRFLGVDTANPTPADPLTLNRYSYALGDPINNFDPDGRMPADTSCGYNADYEPYLCGGQTSSRWWSYNIVIAGYAKMLVEVPYAPPREVLVPIYQVVITEVPNRGGALGGGGDLSRSNPRDPNAYGRCSDSLLGQAAIRGLADFFGVPPNALDDLNLKSDTASILKEVAADKQSAVALAYGVSRLLAYFTTERGEIRLAANLSGKALPWVGWGATAYLAYSGTKTAVSWYEEQLAKGACDGL